MELKTYSPEKLHTPTLERHAKALEDAQSYLLGILAGSVLEGNPEAGDFFMAMARGTQVIKEAFLKMIEENQEKVSTASTKK